MTRHRKVEHRARGVNASLGNCLANERDRMRKAHRRGAAHRPEVEGEDVENAAFIDKEIMKNIDSVIDESSLDEFLARAELAGTEFTADRGAMQFVNDDVATVVPSTSLAEPSELDAAARIELERRMRIPRRPDRNQFENAAELLKAENDVFLQWRGELAQLQDRTNGLVLTPFEKNPEMWRELWRVVERSDLVCQIVDARNPLLFRSLDLESYVLEVDVRKANLLLLNKADLLTRDQCRKWAQYFKEKGVHVAFWSALEETSLKEIEEESEGNDDDEEDEESEDDDDEEEAESGSDEEAKDDSEDQEEENSDLVYLDSPDALLSWLKKMGRETGLYGSGRQLVVGMVGYPNVGKSSTINKLVGRKVVSVSATPGKTRRLQTIPIDDELGLCDCPGLVMPSLAFSRAEMVLHGILPIDQLRDHWSPAATLIAHAGGARLAKAYSIMLPTSGPDELPTPHDLLASVAFVRGFMSSAGVPDCSRAARLIFKDVVSGKFLVRTPPPGTSLDEFDPDARKAKVDRELEQTAMLAGVNAKEKGDKTTTKGTVGKTQLEQMAKRGLLEASTGLRAAARLDSTFFESNSSARGAHIKGRKLVVASGQGHSTVDNDKKHHKRGTKKKLRNLYVEADHF